VMSYVDNPSFHNTTSTAFLCGVSCGKPAMSLPGKNKALLGWRHLVGIVCTGLDDAVGPNPYMVTVAFFIRAWCSLG
jgi:hypothetical protein